MERDPLLDYDTYYAKAQDLLNRIPKAAAITIALDIDDHSYRDAQFYPSDLSEFARQTACGSR